MAKSKSIRPATCKLTKTSTYRYMLEQITRRAFRNAFNEAIMCAAALKPNGTVETTVTEYLASMRAELEALEAR